MRLIRLAARPVLVATARAEPRVYRSPDRGVPPGALGRGPSSRANRTEARRLRERGSRGAAPRAQPGGAPPAGLPAGTAGL